MSAAKLPLARMRTTSAMRARDASIRKLIAALRERELDREDIAELLGFGPSGVRKYIKDLTSAGVIVINRYIDPTPFTQGSPVFHLSPDAAHVDAFLAMIDIHGAKSAKGGAPTGLQIAQRDPTRHFHLLRDDIGYKVRVSRNHVKRDPLALPPEFFAPSAGYCERRIVEPVERVRATGFAALAGVRFEMTSGAV